MEELPSSSDINDAKPLYTKRHLYLKPLLKINISIQLPSLKLVGKSISNITLMDNIRDWASPDKFSSVKVKKCTLEFIRFEADLLNPSKVHAILARLDGRQVTLSGFKETVKVRASIAKSDFPSRHDWDSYFRDAKHMNEMKAGERPDTIHLSDLPNKWFSTKSSADIPSEGLLKKIFQQFGEVTAVDIPCIDPYRSKMKAHLSGLKLFNFNQNTTFEAYVQYRDYISFVKAMDYFRGMKLLKIDSDKTCTTNIKVDFDKTKHLSETSIRKRKIEREKLMAKDRELEEKRPKSTDNSITHVDNFKDGKQIQDKHSEFQQNENHTGKMQHLSDNRIECQNKESTKILKEKKLLLTAQRKLESIRLLTELLKIIKENKRKIHFDASFSHDKMRQNHKQNTGDGIVKEEVYLNLNKNTLLEKDLRTNGPCMVKESCFTEEAKNRLHSEVIKVDHAVSGGNHLNEDGQTSSYKNPNGARMSSRKRTREHWPRTVKRCDQSIAEQSNEYYRTTHHLYYKYFQSLARNVPTSSNCKSQFQSRSSNKSSKRSRSRSKTRIDSSWPRKRSQSHNSPRSGTKRKLS